MVSTGALMVSGEWGCGKTYHIEKVIIPTLQQEGWNPVKVSLFGIESVNEIPLRIADNYKSAESDKGERTEKEKNKSRLCSCGKEKVGKVVAKGAQFASSISWLESFVDVKTLVRNYSGLLYKLIPTEKTVIILDDIERVIDTIDVHTLLGVINDLVEQRGYKVIVIANNSYMQQKGQAKLVFKEKVIEKTLVYEPDVVSIFKELCEKDYSSLFTKFMAAQKAVEVIDPSYPSYKDDKGLQVELHNIRILKFALAHFNKIYEVCDAFLENEDEDCTSNFLLSLWACTVGVAIEYKKDRLTYKDRLQFAQYIDLPSIWGIDDDGQETSGSFDEAGDEEAEDKQKEEKQSEYIDRRVTYIFNRLVKSHKFHHIVSLQMYDFVTAGMSLDKEGLKAEWEEYKRLVQRDNISPAYALLQKFRHSRWDMSNEEMADAVMQLAQYVEDGEFRDNMAYVDSATYLQHLSSLTPLSEDDMQTKIRCGIDKMYENVETLNTLDKLNLDAVETHIPKESWWVVEYERKKMDEITKAKLDADIEEARRQFNEDLPTLANRLTFHYGDNKTPDFLSYPILSCILGTDIIKKVNGIQPKEVMALYRILNGRFLEYMADQKVYDAELPFVENLEEAIEQKNIKETTYADILIEDHLKGIIKKIKSREQSGLTHDVSSS